MPDFSPYLLYTDSAIREFKIRHAADLKENMAIYRNWIRNLKLMEWTHYVRHGASDKEIAYIVGILCCIHEELPRQVRFDFNQGAYMIRRSFMNEDEYNQWLNSSFL